MEHDNCDHCGKNIGHAHNTDNSVVWCVPCFIAEQDVLRQIKWHSFDVEYYLGLYSRPDVRSVYLRWTIKDNVDALKKIPPKNTQPITIRAQANPPTQQQEPIVSDVCKKHYYGIGECTCSQGDFQ